MAVPDLPCSFLYAGYDAFLRISGFEVTQEMVFCASDPDLQRKKRLVYYADHFDEFSQRITLRRRRAKGGKGAASRSPESTRLAGGGPGPWP